MGHFDTDDEYTEHKHSFSPNTHVPAPSPGGNNDDQSGEEGEIIKVEETDNEERDDTHGGREQPSSPSADKRSRGMKENQPLPTRAGG